MPAPDTLTIPNPLAELQAVDREGTVASITVRAPVKGQALRITSVERSREPEIFNALLLHLVTGGVAAAGNTASDAERSRLASIGFLVRPDEVSTPVWYSCDIASRLFERAANRAQPSEQPTADLMVNPTLRHLGSDGPPPSMRGRLHLANRFQTDRSWLWLNRPDVSAPCVYSYGRDLKDTLDVLQPGEPWSSVSADLTQQLLEVGVIESAAHANQLRRSRDAQLEGLGRELRSARYAILPNIVSARQLAAVRNYYRNLIQGGFLPFGDAEWPHRFFSARDPLAQFFHTQLNELMSAIAGEPLKPSFSFFASYRQGSELPPHRDREQCEYSMSILVDYDPEPDDLSPWPIFLQPPDAPSATPVRLGIGDGVLYFGREVRHYREKLERSDSCSCWFFFYVPEAFDGPLE